MITVKDIQNLAQLSRLKVEESMLGIFTAEIGTILGYVEQIQHLMNKDGIQKISKGTGLVKNVMRNDEVRNPAGTYTKKIMDVAPDTEAGFIAVKKIL